MKNYFLFLLLIVLSSCIAEDYSYLSSIQSSQVEVEDVRRSRSIRTPSRNNVCEDSSRCEDICDRMFEYSSERRSCYRKSLSDIGIIEDVFDILKHSHYIKNDLDEITARDFDLFAEVGLKSLNKVVTGDYRSSERDEDDDDEDDDSHDDHGVEFNGYDSDDARTVLEWIFDSHSSIGTSIADFSKSTELLYNLFIEASGDSASILGDKGLSSDDKKVLHELSNSDTHESPINKSFLTSTDKDSPLLDHVHEMISDLCQSADIDSLSSSKSFKICLSYTYFNLIGLSCSSISRDRGIGYFMLKEGYREQPQSHSCSTDIGLLKDFDNWSDYWD